MYEKSWSKSSSNLYKKILYSIETVGTYWDEPVKVRHWKRYAKVNVLVHQYHSGITGLFKTKQCSNSNTQVKMIIAEGSKEYELSDSDAKRWIESRK